MGQKKDQREHFEALLGYPGKDAPEAAGKVGQQLNREDRHRSGLRYAKKSEPI
ncbi:unnamed protein product, partial [Gulo gulo]